MFIDQAVIRLKAGKGGDGAVAFRREKYVPAGGPQGGDGGKGGDIVFTVDESMRTLMDFRYKKSYQAENGENGGKKNMFGKDGEDLVLKVPPGTIIKDEKTGQILADLIDKDDRVVIAQGGKGGKGNTHFKTATRQAPRFAIAGQAGEMLAVVLELKLIADVGLIGFPNVGKSTFLSVVTSAVPKIANYHFTTITPNLGMVTTRFGDSFVLADIPGLIEGAHEGVGLGHDFLRHVERTKLLVHVVDVASVEGRDPLEDFDKINHELKQYSEKLAAKYQVVAANKTDVLADETYLTAFTQKLEERGYRVFPISAATHTGFDPLLAHVSEKLKEIEAVPLVNPEDDPVVYRLRGDEKLFTVSKEENTYIIEGQFVVRLLNSTNLADMDSLTHFYKVLRKRGIIDELKELGIQDGDVVRIDDTEFEYYD